ncbi:MAG: thioredoxin-dependent thiol peroxidase [candidate division KSB1 bacterium]|nr:thioredoxin-dependent thiol peroxidase [candidate division KSB1 bacterium]
MYVREGQLAPDFTLPDSDGRLHRLADYRGRKVVLYFYPKDGTPGCTTEACSFRDAYSILQEHGIVVLGVSPDSVSSHRKFAEKHGLPFPLLSDPEHKVIEAYGAWQEKTLYGKRRFGVARTTYLIDEEGRVLRVFTNVKPEGHAEEVLLELGIKE